MVNPQLLDRNSNPFPEPRGASANLLSLCLSEPGSYLPASFIAIVVKHTEHKLYHFNHF